MKYQLSIFVKSNDQTIDEIHRFNNITGHKVRKIINKHLEKHPIKSKNKNVATEWTSQLTYNYMKRPQEVGKEWFDIIKLKYADLN